MTEAPLHPALEPVAFLIGTWLGDGEGHYPTIDAFTYGEESRFWHVGRPFLAYSQRTWNLDTGAPMHSEMGFWRPQPEGRVELVLAHTFGLAEIQEGTVAGHHIELTATSLHSTSSAKPVVGSGRVVDVDGSSLTYSMSMAAAEQPLQGHLTARLRRT